MVPGVPHNTVHLFGINLFYLDIEEATGELYFTIEYCASCF